MDLENRKVLVTGADGFIGSHLAEYLAGLGCKVRAFVYYNSFNSLGWLDSIPDEKRSKLEFFSGDIRDSHGVEAAMKDVDLVFHLAALIGIPFSYHSPDAYVDTNIRGTLNILQAARKLSTPRVLVTSTSEVYGTARYTPIDEEHPFQGQSPYSATKIGADRLTESFFRSFDLPVTIVRPFNTYGPRQSARAVIPTIITQLLNGENTLHLGDISPTRDLVFVRDTVRAFAALASAKSAIGQEVNVATESEISVGDLATRLIQAINPRARVVIDDQRLRPPKSEVFRLCGSNRKIHELTGWKPIYDIDRGLAETIEWFRQPVNLARYKHDVYNL